MTVPYEDVDTQGYISYFIMFISWWTLFRCEPFTCTNWYLEELYVDDDVSDRQWNCCWFD